MVKYYSLNHLNATFPVKLKISTSKADFNLSLISDQFITFLKPDGTTFEKQANLEVDSVNPSQAISLSNIVGDGIEDKITVTVPNTALLKTGELMSITGTSNFNVTNKPITIVTATTFTYQLGSVGSVSAENSGTVTTQGEKKIVYQNTDPESSILDVHGPWEYGARVVLTNGDGFTTRDRSIFWVQ
ncbi:MAG: hypothetical protein JKY15_01985 [Deltaproteobacteria bacterium]|nr:hypothetical protein [Deltaproteobacteria bacterium]